MTGKSDLTSGLCQRLAEVLQVDPGEPLLGDPPIDTEELDPFAEGAQLRTTLLQHLGAAIFH
jgi:hypothetical protein